MNKLVWLRFNFQVGYLNQSITFIIDHFLSCISQRLKIKCEIPNFFVLIFDVAIRKKSGPWIFSFWIATTTIETKKFWIWILVTIWFNETNIGRETNPFWIPNLEIKSRRDSTDQGFGLLSWKIREMLMSNYRCPRVPILIFYWVLCNIMIKKNYNVQLKAQPGGA